EQRYLFPSLGRGSSLPSYRSGVRRLRLRALPLDQGWLARSRPACARGDGCVPCLTRCSSFRPSFYLKIAHQKVPSMRATTFPCRAACSWQGQTRRHEDTPWALTDLRTYTMADEEEKETMAGSDSSANGIPPGEDLAADCASNMDGLKVWTDKMIQIF